MDAERSLSEPRGGSKNHFQEALVLASKVAHAPHSMAEICISDDPEAVRNIDFTSPVRCCKIEVSE